MTGPFLKVGIDLYFLMLPMPPSQLPCGTHAVSWLPENLPVIGDPEKDVEIFFAWQSNDQHRKKPAKVVACDDQGNTMYL